jgi:hypothetical protein
MTASLQPESRPASRRALLAGALGGLGALAASAIGRPNVARATDPNDVVLGGTNTATTTTTIQNATTGATVFYGHSTSSIGVYGASSSERGVYGTTESYSGVYGESLSSSDGWGVYGFSNGTDKAGTVGHSYSYTGVVGHSGVGSPAGKTNTGVYGYAAQDETAVGVHGESIDGIGVLGLATGSGVAAFGLFARSDSADAAAIGARSAGDSTAVLAKSGTGTFPPAKAKTAVYGYAAQDSSSKGLWGETTSGHALHGTATSGYAGYFGGKVYTTKWYELTEISTPAAPSTNRARLFARVNSSGKTQLCVRFQSGGVQVIKTEP